ncbi:unnamed protein product [Somion occarium]|uniref:Sas10 C-terminal domain-containing protein n=1 Tax=Somion occarium TaxID=3059160 RepID=A0ABP1DZP5_9APHY
MARKHTTKPKSTKSRPRAFNKKDSSVPRWNKPQDIPMDEEDRFHAARDQILLDGAAHDSDDEGDEDEVFALKGLPEDSDEDESDGDEMLDDDDPYKNLPEMPKDKPKKAKKKGKAVASSSEDESEDESEEEGWGKKSEYYASNEAQIDSEDEEANEMEEQEAKRLQLKTRDAMADDDFGLDDVVDTITDVVEDILEDPVAAVSLPLPQDKEGLLRHLEKTSPESLALARDWDDTARMLIKAQTKLAELEAESPDVSLGLNHIHYQALLTYATTLAFYLHLRSSPKYVSRPDLLRSHPVMSRLLSLKQSLTTLEELGIDPLGDFSDSDDAEDLSDLSDLTDEDLDASMLWKMDMIKGLEQDELEALLKEAGKVIAGEDGNTKKGKKKKSRKADVEDGEEVQEQERPKKKRKTSTKSALPIFDLEEPTFPSSSTKSKKSKTVSESLTDAYGEQLTLQTFDAQDKAAHKKSLRFHTSRIESTIGRRERARQGNVGGDDDIPWKERKKEKEERLRREVENSRAKGQGEALDGVDPESMDVDGEREGGKGKRRREEEEDSGSESGEDGYYELVKKQSKAKKEKKKAGHDAANAAAKAHLMQEATTNGPRSLTQAMIKNKGLTPHRSKSVRNPRVKKRQRYERAKKKVSSQKAVFRGGVGASGKYEGEKTGISKVIKSVRL